LNMYCNNYVVTVFIYTSYMLIKKIIELVRNNTHSYNELTLETKGISGFKFTWFTDGIGWNTAKHNLEETFDVLDNLYNLNDLENGIIKKLVNPKDFIEDSLK